MFASLNCTGSDIGKVPRQYNFWDFWKATFCPNFHPYAFPFVVWLVNTIMYLTTLIYSNVVAPDPTKFDPNPTNMYRFVFIGPRPGILNYPF